MSAPDDDLVLGSTSATERLTVDLQQRSAMREINVHKQCSKANYRNSAAKLWRSRAV